jgi:hypothetical protein
MCGRPERCHIHSELESPDETDMDKKEVSIAAAQPHPSAFNAQPQVMIVDVPTPHSSRPSKRCATLVGSRIMKSDGICLRHGHRSDKFEFEVEVRAIHSMLGIAQHVRWAGFRSI